MDWIFKIRLKGEYGEVEMSQEFQNKIGEIEARTQIIKEAVIAYKELK